MLTRTLRHRAHLGVVVLALLVCLWIGGMEAKKAKESNTKKKSLTPDLMQMLEKTVQSAKVEALLKRRINKGKENMGVSLTGEQMTEEEMMAAAGITSDKKLKKAELRKKAWQDVPRPGDRNYEKPVKFESDILAERMPSPEEEAVARAVYSYITSTRSPDSTITYADVHPGLKTMGLNASIAAADIYNGFSSVTWIDLFEERIICDLDLALQKPLIEGGLVFDTPKYCVKDVVSMQIQGSSMDALKTAAARDYSDYINDLSYEIVGGACARHAERRYTEKPVALYFCQFFFVEMSHILTSDECACTTTAGNCCTRALNPSIEYVYN